MSGTDSVMLEIVPRPSGVAPGDFNYDGLVGLSDFAFLARCLGGPGLPAAITCPTDFNTDMDADEDVDLGDVAEFQRIVSVPP